MFLLTHVHKVPLWQKQDSNSVCLGFSLHHWGQAQTVQQVLAEPAQDGSWNCFPFQVSVEPISMC